jgi:predicted acetyltransferase
MASEKLLPPGVELVPAAREQEPVLANLLELYAHDFSEFVDLVIGSDGRFHYPRLPLYWLEETRFPFLVKVDGHLAGLVLVSRGSLISDDPQVWDMAELFIMRRYRRRGIGAALAQEVWRRFPGAWEVRVRESNTTALVFWEATINGFAGSSAEAISVEEGGTRRRIFSFMSSGADGS